MAPNKEMHSGPLMWSEILDQPETLIRVVESGLDELSQSRSKSPFSARFLSRVKQAVIIGNGSSYHAACLARDYFLHLARIPARAAFASDAFRIDHPRPRRTLALALSHSGSSDDVLKAASRARRRTLTTAAITNIDESPLSRVVDQCWVTGAGAEQAIPSTKGFTAIAAASLLLAFHAGEAKGVSTRGVKEAAKLITKASKALDKWLALPERVRTAAQLLAGAKAIALVGKNILYPVACDGALKLLEVTYIPAFAYPPEEFRHGPIAMADERFALIALTPRRRDTVLERVMEDVKASGAKVIAVGEKEPRIGDAWIEVPRVDSLATPLVYMPALQLLAHGVGEALGLPIDVPRGLKKVVGAA